MALLLLALMALLAGGAARRQSVTVDELAHIGAGVSYLQRLDMRMNSEHPPLAKVLAALPLVLRHVHADYSDSSWSFSGHGMFYPYLGQWVFGDYFLLRWNNPSSTLRWARVPMLLVTLLLGFVVYKFGTELGGSSWGGLLCLTAFVTMPAFLVFGPLVITDIIVALFWVLAVWQLPLMWHAPARWQVIKFGLTLAGAFLSKFSSGLIFFGFLAVALSLRFRPVPEQPTEKAQRRAWRQGAWRSFAKATLWAAFFVYLPYLVLSWNQSTNSFNVIPHFPASLLLRRILMPIWLYVSGLALFVLSAGTRPTFILGHSYSHGVWFYFPVLFFLKSILGFLLLLGLATAIALAIRARAASQFSVVLPGKELLWRCLWVSLALYTAACMLNQLDISIRHFSIPLVSIVLLLAPLPRALQFLRDANWRAARLANGSAFALAALMLFTAVHAYPNYFAFINVLGMGRPGYLLVNDSNLDWNQSLPEVEKFVTRRGFNHVLLDEYGFSEPNAYVPQAQLWDCQQPSASDHGQWAILSANLIADGSNCSWLLKYVHLELAGGGMYAILLPDVIPLPGQPDGPPLPQDYRYFGDQAAGGEDIRTIFYNCIRDPRQLQITMDRFIAEMNQQREKK